MKHLTISFEDSVVETTPDTESTTIKEKEYVVYFRTLDFKQLQNAKHAIKQRQWQFYVPKTDDNAGSGKIRVRELISHDGNTKYEFTIKSEVKDGNIESSIECSKEMFIQIAFLADSGMYKHRYEFPIENSNLKWEIDVYPDGNGGYYPWGRAELEVKEELTELPKLPIEVEEIITPEEASTEEGKVKVKELFSKFFLKKNKYLPTTVPEEIKGEVKDEESTELDNDVSTGDDTDQETSSGDGHKDTEDGTSEDNQDSTDDSGDTSSDTDSDLDETDSNSDKDND